MCLPTVVFAVNNRVVRVHGFTPAQLLFGFTPRGEPEDFTLRDDALTGMVEELIMSWAEEEGIENWTQRTDAQAEEYIHQLDHIWSRQTGLDEDREFAITKTMENQAKVCRRYKEKMSHAPR